jgi:hypothetical protein
MDNMDFKLFVVIIVILFVCFLLNRRYIPKDKYEERLIFYLGEELYHKKRVNIKKYPNLVDINSFKVHEHQGIKTHFDEPLKKLIIKTGNQDRKFSYQPGDVWTGGVDIKNEMPSIITIVKNRDRYENKGVILKCLDLDRHWGFYYHKPKDISFADKKDIIIWRGVTTGQSSNPGNRFDLVKKWYNVDPQIDVGFNKIVQDRNEYSKYLKNTQSPTQMLKNKYILSVEGNDKDSGLNWKLNSNSLVLMPKPLSTTWLMERKLIPNHHYILLKNDFSDLKDKLEWCKRNQDKCKVIIQNANKYMSQFKDEYVEKKLEEDIIRLYFEKVK